MERAAPIDRTCPLCGIYVQKDVEQIQWKIDTDDKVIHRSCAKRLSEVVLTSIFNETTKIRKKKKKKKKHTSVNAEVAESANS